MSDDEPVRDLTTALRFLQVAVARQREDARPRLSEIRRPPSKPAP